MIRQDTEDQTEEEYRRELEQQTLNRLRNYLCDHLEPERFFPYLQTKEYLDPESCERIRSAGTTKSRVNKMLDILIRSGPRPLKVLIRAIEKNGPTQKFVTDKMNGEFLKIQNDPSNLERLAAIRMQLIQGATAQYVIHPGQPPPYEPPGHFGVTQHGFSYPASSFSISRSYVSNSVTSGKAVDQQPEARRPEQLHNGNIHPVRVTLKDVSPKFPAERYQPISPLEAPESLARLPSSFHTADFPPSYPQSYEVFPFKKTRPYLGDDKPSQPMREILGDQLQEERKISLNVTTSGVVATLPQNATASKDNSVKTAPTPPYRWTQSQRVPSEHDASVVTQRSSPRNASSPILGSPENSETATASTTSPKHLTDDPYVTTEAGTPTRMRPISPASASIQPSCFTSSIFNTCVTQEPSKVPTIPKLNKPKVVNPLSVLSPGKQYSTQLEPIPSIEVESTENQTSLTARLPPTEHEDTSILPANQSDEDASSLEISTDSDVSEQQ